ncbi:hypothetical protein B0H10DRAFT_2065719 [Mycena sp. CBHHK59/15]|nr:hypothetical protein B0H10DRAFT_2065719 [Mycena sp. CBHHK59/15]
MSTSSDMDGLQTEVAIFNAISFLAVFSLALVAATAYFSSTVHRSGLWFRHIISWILYSAVFLLLIGRQLGPNPPFGLCMVQAALIYAAPTFPTLSAFGFVADLYIGLSAAVYRKRKIRPALTTFLLRFPQIVSLCIFLEVIMSVGDPRVVVRHTSHLYCHVTVPTPSLISASIIVGTGLLIFPLEIWIAVILCLNWMAFRRSQSRPDPHVSLTMFIRVGLFTVMSLLGIGLSSLSLGTSNVAKPFWTRLVLPIVPIIAAVTFGSQEDIMKSWIFWRDPEPVAEPAVSSKEADTPDV